MRCGVRMLGVRFITRGHKDAPHLEDGAGVGALDRQQRVGARDVGDGGDQRRLPLVPRDEPPHPKTG
jgi:hypothetical protein